MSTADVLFRVRRAHVMTREHATCQAIAIKEGRILATATGHDDLSSLIGPGTRIIDDPDLILLPAFNDTHNHQLLAARDLDYVDLAQASTIAELIAIIAATAKTTKPGEWIVTNRCWHETHLAESRLPTAAELDSATAEHPVFVQRGGHVAVANTRALALAGITRESEDPPSGTVVRLPDRTPLGVLIEGGALDPVRRLLPRQTQDQEVGLLARQCRRYNEHGIGAVREPGLFPGDIDIYQRLLDDGGLTTRSRVLHFVFPQPTVSDTKAFIDALPRPARTEMLGVWGLKFGMDGGVEGGFLCEPYANNPDYRGHAFWPPDDFEQVVDHAVSTGWRVGCHAVGDCAVTRVLDAYQNVLARHPDTRPGTLVIEHAFLASPTERQRAIRLGIGITVQHPLLYSLGGNLLRYWGEERTSEVMPVRAWVDENALVAAGSDCNVSFFDPMLSIWGLITRGTRTVGVQGPQYRVDRYTAFELYTAAGGRLLGEPAGTLTPGAYADLTGFRTDPLDCAEDDLPGLRPVLTMAGGRVVHDALS